MSHFSEVKTRLKDKTVLQKVLRAGGYALAEDSDGVDVRGFMGELEKADFKLLTQSHYDIGFRRTSDGQYELVADWDLMPRVAEIEQRSFVNWLKREYAKEYIQGLRGIKMILLWKV